MGEFLGRFAANAAAIAVAVWAIGGLTLVDNARPDEPRTVLTLAVVALVFTAVNSLIRPLAVFLALPFLVLTLGLFILVVNALMLMLTSELTDLFTVGLAVGGFWSAFGGAVVISLVNWVISAAVESMRV